MLCSSLPISSSYRLIGTWRSYNDRDQNVVYSLILQKTKILITKTSKITFPQVSHMHTQIGFIMKMKQLQSQHQHKHFYSLLYIFPYLAGVQHAGSLPYWLHHILHCSKVVCLKNIYHHFLYCQMTTSNFINIWCDEIKKWHVLTTFIISLTGNVINYTSWQVLWGRLYFNMPDTTQIMTCCFKLFDFFSALSISLEDFSRLTNLV